MLPKMIKHHAHAALQMVNLPKCWPITTLSLSKQKPARSIAYREAVTKLPQDQGHETLS
jgi:hypothetical protein